MSLRRRVRRCAEVVGEGQVPGAERRLQAPLTRAGVGRTGGVDGVEVPPRVSGTEGRLWTRGPKGRRVTRPSEAPGS